ncbi:MAG: hypothetical protein ACYCZO_07175, partial [Daejeonella sp.]
VTMMVFANLFLLIWDYNRLKHILPFKQPKTDPHVLEKPLGSTFTMPGREDKRSLTRYDIL